MEIKTAGRTQVCLIIMDLARRRAERALRRLELRLGCEVAGEAS